MSFSVTCPLCQSSTAKLLCYSSSNVDGILGEKLGLFECSQCHTSFTDPQIYTRDNNPIKQYEGGVYQSKKNRLSKAVDFFLGITIDIKINTIANMIKPNATFLDVGCGKGRFLSRVKRRRDYSCLGLEPSEAQAKFGIDHYGVEVIVGTLSDPALDGRIFDAITCWHVFEHIHDARGFLSSINGLLNDDGLLVIEVPNWMSLQAQIGMCNWFHLDTPRHIFHYTKSSLGRLLDESGFDIKKVETYSFDLGTFGLLQTILNLVNISPNLFYRWLKKCELTESKIEVYIAFMFAVILAIPSVVLEFIASILFQSGGVLRIYATKNTNPKRT